MTGVLEVHIGARFSADIRPQPLDRIDRLCAVQPDLEVEVRSGRDTRVSHESHRLPRESIRPPRCHLSAATGALSD